MSISPVDMIIWFFCFGLGIALCIWLIGFAALCVKMRWDDYKKTGE